MDDPARISEAYWSRPVPELADALGSSDRGLAAEEARARRTRSGGGLRSGGAAARALRLLLAQFASPIVLLLLGAAVLSYFLEAGTDSAIILAIVVGSGLLGFRQEWGAALAMERLLSLVRVKAAVVRDGSVAEVPVEEVVPGDVAVLAAGDLVPADGVVIDSRELFVDEASLTGESFPVEKKAGTSSEGARLAERSNVLHLGTSVATGTGRMLVVRTGTSTEFGRVSRSLATVRPETEFERGLRRFGYMLMEVTLILVLVVFAVNVALRRPVIEAFLFSLAIAVGLTPQLLPAIVSVTLARGAREMAKEKVIVKRLAAIENLGGMDVLCSDKTGTLTVGKVGLRDAVDLEGKPNAEALRAAFLNATFQTGYANPIDDAIRAGAGMDAAGAVKLDEQPYDFVRKRLSVLVEEPGGRRIVTKGAVRNVLDVCDRSACGETDFRTAALRLAAEFGAEGARVLGVASRAMGDEIGIDRGHEAGMTFLGLLVFDDPIREGIVETISGLRELGVSTKLITGDGAPVAKHVAGLAGLDVSRVLTGGELHTIEENALRRIAPGVDVFAEIEPNQKERLIRALRGAGHVVGYLGDGVNDAPALHAADVGISVADAVDVAREAADVVLLEKNLSVLTRGVVGGRATFANTMKYIFMATSANFGNMFSVAGASVFLPFLPLLPIQVLLTNLLTDLPEMTIASDRVDEELLARPRRWDLGFIRRFMLVFGAASSFFDYATFGLLALMNASPERFRSAWFVESVVSASTIVLVIRTRRSVHRSRPSRALSLATAAVGIMAILIVSMPPGRRLGFEPLPFGLLGGVGLIVSAYVLTAEALKRWFYARFAG